MAAVSIAPSVPALPHVLLAVTGSVATIKLEPLLDLLQPFCEVRVVISQRARHFLNVPKVRERVTLYQDEDEWQDWKRGDPVLHIELRRWANVFLIAPLSANTLAEIANGLCPNLVSCVVRAWDFHKPLLIAPAMNTNMWQHPLTAKQLATVQSFGISTVTVISPITKLLACGDTGVGAMAEVADIADTVRDAIARPSPPAESSLALPAVIGHNPIGLLRPGDFVMRPNLLNNGASVRTKRIVQMSNEELCAGHWWPTYFYGPHNKCICPPDGKEMSRHLWLRHNMSLITHRSEFERLESMENMESQANDEDEGEDEGEVEGEDEHPARQKRKTC